MLKLVLGGSGSGKTTLLYARIRARAEQGLRSQVSGSVELNLEELIDRKVYRFMGDAAAFAYLSMQQAIALGHLGWKGQPVGRLVGSGTRPCMVFSSS